MSDTGYQYADRLYGLPAAVLWALADGPTRLGLTWEYRERGPHRNPP